MNCDLENSFLPVYLSGPLIITYGSRGAAQVDPPHSQWACLRRYLPVKHTHFGFMLSTTVLNICLLCLRQITALWRTSTQWTVAKIIYLAYWSNKKDMHIYHLIKKTSCSRRDLAKNIHLVFDNNHSAIARLIFKKNNMGVKRSLD